MIRPTTPIHVDRGKAYKFNFIIIDTLITPPKTDNNLWVMLYNSTVFKSCQLQNNISNNTIFIACKHSPTKMFYFLLAINRSKYCYIFMNKLYI